MENSLELLAPANFLVAKVYSFNNPFTNIGATVGYLRPYTQDYDAKQKDIFDLRFEEWLNELNLKNVRMILSRNIIFKGQLEALNKTYVREYAKTNLVITAYGDYSIEELASKKTITGYSIDLPIYWNSLEKDLLTVEGGIMTFNKEHEHFFIEVFKSLKPIV